MDLLLAEIYLKYQSYIDGIGFVYDFTVFLWHLIALLFVTAVVFIGIMIFAIMLWITVSCFSKKFRKEKPPRMFFITFLILAVFSTLSYYVVLPNMNTFVKELEEEPYQKFVSTLTVEQKQFLNKEIYILIFAEQEVLTTFELDKTFNKEYYEDKIKNNSTEFLFNQKELKHLFSEYDIEKKSKNYQKNLLNHKKERIRQELNGEINGLENNLEKSESQSKDCVTFCPR